MVQPGVCTAPPQGGLGQGHENPKRGVIACPEGPVPKERDCRSRQSSWAERKVHAARGLSSGCRALKSLGFAVFGVRRRCLWGAGRGRPPQKASSWGLVTRWTLPWVGGELEIGVSHHQPVTQCHPYIMKLPRAGLGQGGSGALGGPREGVGAAVCHAFSCAFLPSGCSRVVSFIINR